MALELNHIIVHVKDRHESAEFLAGLLGADAPVDWAHFTQLTSSNGVGVDFADHMVAPEDINLSHLAYLVTEEEFDAIFSRVEQRGVRFWADPAMKAEGQINLAYGGRSIYLLDPGGTCAIEFMTKPYAEVPESRPTPA
ncbi:VOC family protein [Streptomyces syringium]|uniref:VOC family protein n=1 Tax=Streptomyces syringium TaxID=76729 RepID=UPI0034217DBA